MTLISRATSPISRCATRRGREGCYTTGWQDHVELHGAIVARMRRSLSFTRHLQRLFKMHARSIPSFLPLDHEHQTFLPEQGLEDAILMQTECTQGAPTWDLRRPGRYVDGCKLFTFIEFA